MSGVGWEALPRAFDEAAAAILVDCPQLGTREAAQAEIAALRQDANGEVYGWIEGDTLVAVYGLRNSGLHFDLLWLGVDPAWRARRYGRAALVDALRRCGRKPMTVEASADVKGWFERVGFKTVGRKSTDTGDYRYRLGWYAPRRPDEAGFGAH